MDHLVGSIEPGKFADFAVLEAKKKAAKEKAKKKLADKLKKLLD